MKASELIALLQAEIANSGDLDVVIEHGQSGAFYWANNPETLALFDRYKGQQYDLSPHQGDDEAFHTHLIALSERPIE